MNLINKLNFLGYNARTIASENAANREKLGRILQSQKYDVVMINETHITAPIASRFTYGYKIFAIHKENDRGGGTLIAIKAYLNP